MMSEHREPGTLASCEYGLFLPNATDARIAFTLGDMAHESADLRQRIVRLLVVFFHEIRDIAPELSELSFTVANDERLH